MGEQGLGKAQLINSLFLCDIYNDEFPSSSERITNKIKIDQFRLQMWENSVNMRLEISDVPGFGAYVNNNNSWNAVTEYIEGKFLQFHENESEIDRCEQSDDFVHACLYFLSPHNPKLKPLDIECLKSIHELVNIILVIAKADGLTVVEREEVKNTIRDQIDAEGIHVYEFTDLHDERQNK